MEHITKVIILVREGVGLPVTLVW